MHKAKWEIYFWAILKVLSNIFVLLEIALFHQASFLIICMASFVFFNQMINCQIAFKQLSNNSFNIVWAHK
jgi:hypothetical protein